MSLNKTKYLNGLGRLKLGALAVVCGFAGAAQAQESGSVNLYGLLDVGVDYTSNVAGTSRKQENAGVLAPNIFGIKGQEDLGDGDQAFFLIESQFAMDSGSTVGNMWGRHAYVGLRSKQWGSLEAGVLSDFMFEKLSLGRYGGDQMFPYIALTFYRQGPFSRFLPSGSFDYDLMAATSRINNAVRYDSPVLNGFSFGALYGLGEQTTGTNRADTVSLGASYVNGPWTLQAAGTRKRLAELNEGRDGLQTFGAGGRYDMRNGASLDFLYTNAKNTLTGGKIDTYEVGTLQSLTARVGLILQYTYMKGNDVIGGAAANQINTGLHYVFSKRTRVYASYSWQKVSGGDGLDHAQLLGTDGQSSGNTQGLFRVGVFHAF